MKKGKSVPKLIRATKIFWQNSIGQIPGIVNIWVEGINLVGLFFNNWNYNDSFVLAEVKLIYFFF